MNTQDVELAGLKKWVKSTAKKVVKIVKKTQIAKLVKMQIRTIKKNPILAVAATMFIPGAGALVAKAATSIGGIAVKGATAIGQILIPATTTAAKTMATAYVITSLTGQKQAIVETEDEQLVAQGNAVQLKDGSIKYISELGEAGVRAALAEGGQIVNYIKQVSETTVYVDEGTTPPPIITTQTIMESMPVIKPVVPIVQPVIMPSPIVQPLVTPTPVKTLPVKTVNIKSLLTGPNIAIAGIVTALIIANSKRRKIL